MKFLALLFITAVALADISNNTSSNFASPSNPNAVTGQTNSNSNIATQTNSNNVFATQTRTYITRTWSGVPGTDSSNPSSTQGYGSFDVLPSALASFNTTSTSPATSTFLDGKLNLTLTVSTSVPATVFWYAIDQFSSDIDIGKHGITVSLGGASLGYGIIARGLDRPFALITNATLTVNSDLSKFGDKIGLFYIDPSTHFFGQVSTSVVGGATVYNLGSNHLSAVYFFGSISKTASIPLLFNIPCQLSGGDRHGFSFQSGLSLNITNSANSTLVVIPRYNTSGQIPARARSIGVFFDISVDVQSQLNATLSYSFNSTLLVSQGIKPSSLRWAVYNETTVTWTFLTSGFSIDLEAQIVYQQVDHFSQWAVYSADDTGASSVGGDGSTTSSIFGGNGTTGAASSVVCSALAVICAIALLV